MVDKLIEAGKGLEVHVESGAYGGKMISGIEFEAWAAKTILFLESKFPTSSITAKAVSKNKDLNADSYGNFEFLLGTLLAVKDMLEEQRKEDAAQAALIRELNY